MFSSNYRYIHNSRGFRNIDNQEQKEILRKWEEVYNGLKQEEIRRLSFSKDVFSNNPSIQSIISRKSLNNNSSQSEYSVKQLFHKNNNNSSNLSNTSSSSPFVNNRNPAEKIPFIPLCYFGEGQENNFEIVDVYYKMRNIFESFQKIMHFIKDIVQANSDSFDNMDIYYAKYNIRLDSIETDFVRSYFMDTIPSFSILEDERFNKIIEDKDGTDIKQIMENQKKCRIFKSKKEIDSPLFIQIFLESYTDERTKKMIERLLMEYNRIRDTLIEEYELYYGLLSFQSLFDFKVINEMKREKNKKDKKDKNKEKKMKKAREEKLEKYEVVSLLDNTANEEKSVFSNENRSDLSTELYESSFYYGDYKKKMYSIYQNIIKHYSFLQIAQKCKPSELFIHLMCIDFYTTMFILYFVNKDKFNLFSKIDQRIKAYSSKIFSIFNKYIDRFIEWREKIEKITKKKNNNPNRYYMFLLEMIEGKRLIQDNNIKNMVRSNTDNKNTKSIQIAKYCKELYEESHKKYLNTNIYNAYNNAYNYIYNEFCNISSKYIKIFMYDDNDRIYYLMYVELINSLQKELTNIPNPIDNVKNIYKYYIEKFSDYISYIMIINDIVNIKEEEKIDSSLHQDFIDIRNYFYGTQPSERKVAIDKLEEYIEYFKKIDIEHKLDKKDMKKINKIYINIYIELLKVIEKEINNRKESIETHTNEQSIESIKIDISDLNTKIKEINKRIQELKKFTTSSPSSSEFGAYYEEKMNEKNNTLLNPRPKS
jgi:hypothetical protein